MTSEFRTSTPNSRAEIERIRQDVKSAREALNRTILETSDKAPGPLTVEAVIDQVRSYIQSVADYLPDELVYDNQKSADLLIDTNDLKAYSAVDFPQERRRYPNPDGYLWGDREQIFDAIEKALIGS